MRSSLASCLVVVLVGVGAALCADVQVNRRDRLEPELVIESDGRMSTCDVLTFTDDGKQLLAVGDDKVVRVWDFVDGKLRPAERAVLRWSVWREQRGAIYALALSPDKENKYVAVGGLGALNTTVTVLDRTTGQIVHTVTPVKKGENYYAVWSLAYAPSGKKLAFGTGDGSVFIWDFKEWHWCGCHVAKPNGDRLNRVLFLKFVDENTILSVAKDGSVSQWDVGGAEVQRTKLPQLTAGNQTLVHAELSADGQWLVGAHAGPLLAVRSLDGKRQRDIRLKEGEFPRALAFDPRQKNRLAVTVGSLVPGSAFHVEADYQIRFYDMSDDGAKATNGPPHSYRAECLAFHPKEKYLAVAGGDNHEVTLWNLDKTTEPASVMRGAGSCLWGVALSANGEQLAFQDQRDAKSPDPNRRGSGAWRVFDLPRRQWRPAANYKPVEQLNTADGWSIEMHPDDPYQWYAISPTKNKFLLPRFKNQEEMPRCYTFLKAEGDKPTRVAVGHYWGLSLYELTDKGAKRTRVFAGHQGEVMALAVSADHTWIVSVANDQTVAAWNIADTFKSNPILGAAFAIKHGDRDRLIVKSVDVGSPAWEAGLLVDDEVTQFAFATKEVPGGPTAWLERLENPVPGLEHYFVVRRGGHALTTADRVKFGFLGGVTADWIEGQVVEMGTTARHRPLWRFFPTRDGEWALWMWQNSFYDCSTKGDSYIGWHVNAPDLGQAPTYYRAEQFRKLLERADVLDKLLDTRDVRQALREVSDNPLPLSFGRFEPPAVALELGATNVTDKDVKVKVFATAAGTNPDYQPDRAELWINGTRLVGWKNLATWAKDGSQYSLEVVVPNDKLRTGRNVVTFQTYNRLGGRAEIASAVVCQRPLPRRRLFGLMIGINDYSSAQAAGARDKLVNLNNANNDARELDEQWRQQSGLYDGKPDLILRLDKDAKREEVLKALDDLAKKVGPDDNCVIFLAGHGLFVQADAKKDEPRRSTFVFCGPDFDLKKPLDTGLSSEILYEKLAAIGGHKVVIVDACHSGEAAVNPVRGLVPNGQGPVILAACDRNQVSYEFPPDAPNNPRHGLFTYAILQALGEKFADADADHNGELDAAEIFKYTRRRMPELLKRIDQREYAQQPIMFAPAGTLAPLAKSPK